MGGPQKGKKEEKDAGTFANEPEWRANREGCKAVAWMRVCSGEGGNMICELRIPGEAIHWLITWASGRTTRKAHTYAFV